MRALNKRKIMVTGGTQNKHKRMYEQQLISEYREQYHETSLYQFKIILSYIHKIFIESYKNKPQQQSTGTSALLRNMFRTS